MCTLPFLQNSLIQKILDNSVNSEELFLACTCFWRWVFCARPGEAHCVSKNLKGFPTLSSLLLQYILSPQRSGQVKSAEGSLIECSVLLMAHFNGLQFWISLPKHFTNSEWHRNLWHTPKKVNKYTLSSFWGSVCHLFQQQCRLHGLVVH